MSEKLIIHGSENTQAVKGNLTRRILQRLTSLVIPVSLSEEEARRVFVTDPDPISPPPISANSRIDFMIGLGAYYKQRAKDLSERQ